MRPSIIYRNRTSYELLMRALYGKHYTERFQAIARLIPDGAAAVDLCCGPATLYTRFLRGKSVDYLGLDFNEDFIIRLNDAGGRGETRDLHTDAPLPEADFVIMQSSLYHFLPEPGPIIDRMLTAARRQVIITEPVRNMATSDSWVMASLARHFSNAGNGPQADRFTESRLDEFFSKYGPTVMHQALIAGGREKLYVLRPQPRDTDSRP